MVEEPCPEDDWVEFIPKIDTDNSGTISFSEFLHALYHWFAEENTDIEGEKPEEKDDTDNVFIEIKRIYNGARSASGTKRLDSAMLSNLLTKLSPTDATPEKLAAVFDKLEPDSEEGGVQQYAFSDFLFATHLLLVGDDESDESGGDSN
jgi:hypothetical protein